MGKSIWWKESPTREESKGNANIDITRKISGRRKEMDESKKRSRKEWIKTAAIVFLSVMLVLTFFSNTFMNYSLPEVAGQNAMSGTITAKIRGTGTVESGDPYNVMVKQVRKVESIEVKVGDSVQKGDILIRLTDEDSDELKTAKKALEDAQDAYDQALLSADVTSQTVAQSQTGTSAATYRSQITAAQKAVEDAEKAVEAAQKEYDNLQKRIDELDSSLSVLQSRTSEAADEKKAVEAAEKGLAGAKIEREQITLNIDRLKNQIEYYAGSVSDNDYISLEAALENAEKAQADKDLDIQAWELQKTITVQAYNDKISEADSATQNEIASLRYQKSQLEAELNVKKTAVTDKTTVLTQKTESLNELTGNITKTLGLESLYKAIAEAKANYEKIASQAVDSVVAAGVSGTITSINVTSGKETNTYDPVVVIQPEGKGYYLSFSVTNEQAKRLSVGDVADLVNYWRYNDVNVVLSSIKPDKNNPGQNKLLTFDVSGDVTPGQSLSLSVGQKSSNYDAIVPNSAIREDNNGKFVLVVESKSSPLGNRYVATRMDVQVLASDDTQSAVSGLYGYEFVITTTTKPVEAGQLVRLSNSN